MSVDNFVIPEFFRQKWIERGNPDPKTLRVNYTFWWKNKFISSIKYVLNWTFIILLVLLLMNLEFFQYWYDVYPFAIWILGVLYGLTLLFTTFRAGGAYNAWRDFDRKITSLEYTLGCSREQLSQRSSEQHHARASTLLQQMALCLLYSEKVGGDGGELCKGLIKGEFRTHYQNLAWWGVIPDDGWDNYFRAARKQFNEQTPMG